MRAVKANLGVPIKGGEYLHSSVFSEWEGVRAAPVILCARGTPTMQRIGRAPTLVLRSRSARHQKGLARRPRLDQHGCPSGRRGTSKLGRVNHFDEWRSTCALGKGGRLVSLVCFWKSSMATGRTARAPFSGRSNRVSKLQSQATSPVFSTPI